MRKLVLFSLTLAALCPGARAAVADENGSKQLTPSAMCTLYLGPVTVGPVTQSLPSITYPCP